MREIRSVIGDRGLFLIYENASPDAEDRDAWLLRWERQNHPLWTALTPEEGHRRFEIGFQSNNLAFLREN